MLDDKSFLMLWPYLYPRAEGRPPSQYYRVLPAGVLGLRLVAVVLFVISAQRRPIAFGPGRAVVSFVWVVVLVLAFASRVGGFVSLFILGRVWCWFWSFASRFGGLVSLFILDRVRC